MSKQPMEAINMDGGAVFRAGLFWERMNDSMFNTLSSHTLSPQEEEELRMAEIQARNDEMAERVKASFANTLVDPPTAKI